MTASVSKCGFPVSERLHTLLVDYSADDNPWYRKLLGHGVYTCRPWLPFHLQEITERFYA